ncbi:hypothetical protein NDU88_000563 [Pleurodeles waltl]|uniref:Uncharacterized protein n=1 Tax=Pleurodeles waltl TaxID=8319 RepID=A0AAV7M2S9_PLEWA|nr:hypothetical protein NDU88_000563 [Pleurodeles waltl]
MKGAGPTRVPSITPGAARRQHFIHTGEGSEGGVGLKGTGGAERCQLRLCTQRGHRRYTRAGVCGRGTCAWRERRGFKGRVIYTTFTSNAHHTRQPQRREVSLQDTQVASPTALGYPHTGHTALGYQHTGHTPDLTHGSRVPAHRTHGSRVPAHRTHP